jgi:aminoglycoside phosphotransferase (APT) family kinase protein
VITVASSTEHVRRQTALAACGLDRDLPMTRGPSYANEVWLGSEVALRINVRGVGRLAREARIAARVPREARYPEVITVGHDGEIEWMLVRRVAGIDLGRAWMTMTAAQRERAIHQLADALAALHATPTDGIPDDIRPPHTLPLGPLVELIDEILLPHDAEIAELATAFVTTRWPAFDDRDTGLAHGDPHLENVMWDGTGVSALLDLEWSRPSWLHADLEILLAVAATPRLFAGADYDSTLDPAAFRDLPRWLAAARPAWFDHPRLIDRLEVLALSRVLGVIADDEGEVPDWRWEEVAQVLAGESPLRHLATRLVR